MKIKCEKGSKVKIWAMDIETECTVSTCNKKCRNHGLDPETSRITVVGVYRKQKDDDGVGYVFRDLKELQKWIDSDKLNFFVGQNFGFDVYHLWSHGIFFNPRRWKHDTKIMAAICRDKVTDEFLVKYEEERKRSFPSHREGRGDSLKVMAPFYLGVKPFWEDPFNHDDDDYVLKDARYTFELYEIFKKKIEADNDYDHYKEAIKSYQLQTISTIADKWGDLVSNESIFGNGF